ncbi:hypothetical protein [Streptomyces lycii]|uniref:Transposase n=1 Tax=Streptomyces lycii TaxID=2654337 RepID=A0ABQ7FCN3_9ACTN|nr:hypothetical protein [Streptomyces lycii]KAF4405576.1 hypothetical protein GCU69_29505 [Streptomyces lycii]
MYVGIRDVPIREWRSPSGATEDRNGAYVGEQLATCRWRSPSGVTERSRPCFSGEIYKAARRGGR